MAQTQCDPAYAYCAAEWSEGRITVLDSLPGAVFTPAYGINNAGQIVGVSALAVSSHAVEWSGGSIIDLGADSQANAINNAGLVVGTDAGGAVEWSGGGVIHLEGDAAFGVNDLGQVVGQSSISGKPRAIEWSNGNVIDLGGLPELNIQPRICDQRRWASAGSQSC